MEKFKHLSNEELLQELEITAGTPITLGAPDTMDRYRELHAEALRRMYPPEPKAEVLNIRLPKYLECGLVDKQKEGFQ